MLYLMTDDKSHIARTLWEKGRLRDLRSLALSFLKRGRRGKKAPDDAGPEDLRLYYLALSELGYLGLALRFISRARRRFPSPLLDIEYARELIRVHRPARALELLKNLLASDLTDELIRSCMGLQCLALGSMRAFESAAVWLKKAGEYKTSGNEPLHYRDGIAFYRAVKNFSGGEALIEEAIRKYPDNYFLRMESAFFMMDQMNLSEAAEHLMHASRILPESFTAVYYMGLNLLEMEHYEEARDALEVACSLAPDNDFSSNAAWSAGAALLNLHEYDKAMTWFRAAKDDAMVRVCLNIQIGAVKEEILLNIFQDREVTYFISTADVISCLLLFFQAACDKPAQNPSEEDFTPFQMRKALEKCDLRTLAFKISRDRLIQMIHSGLPVLFHVTSFDGRYPALIYGYDPMRDLFSVAGLNIAQKIRYDAIAETSAPMDGWCLVAFTPEEESRVLNMITRDEDQRFRRVEKVEDDIHRAYLAGIDRKMEDLSRVGNPISRKRMFHLLKMARDPHGNPESTLTPLLKASSNAPYDLAIAARDYYRAGDFRKAIQACALAIRNGDKAAGYLAAQIALEAGLPNLALRFNSIRLSDNPSSPENLIQRAVCLRDLHDYEEAFNFFKFASESHPDDPLLLREMGETYRARAIYDKAEDLLNRALQINPADSSSWEALVNLYEEAICPLSADTACKKAMEENPDESWPLQLYAGHLIRAGLYQEALDLLNGALKNFPEKIEIFLLKADALAALGMVDQAEKEFERLVSRRQGDRAILVEKGFFILDNGQPEDARECFDIALADGEYLPARIGLIHALALDNQYASAYEMIEKHISDVSRDQQKIHDLMFQLSCILDCIPRSVNLLLNVARTCEDFVNAGYLYELTDQYNLAYRIYEKALQYTGDRSQALFRMGQIHHRRGEIDQARDIYQQALANDPRHYGCLEGLALLAMENGQTSLAFRRMEDLIRLYPRHDASVTLYLDLAQNTDSMERAGRFFTSLPPDEEMPERRLLILGEIEDACNHFDLAGEFFQQALEAGETSFDAAIRLAEVRFKQGDHDKALNILNDVQEMHPDEPRAIFLRARIKAETDERKEAISLCLRAIEAEEPDEEHETMLYSFLADQMTRDDIEEWIFQERFQSEYPERFFSRLGETYERRGDLDTARRLYEALKPTLPYSRSFEAVTGLVIIARQEQDTQGLEWLSAHIHHNLAEFRKRPDKFNPQQVAALFEAAATYRETGSRDEASLMESLDYWRRAIRLARAPWSLERAAFVCLDLGELTNKREYFQEGLCYLREIANPFQRPSPVSIAMADLYYHLEMYERAATEYSRFFRSETDRGDPVFETPFMRYLDALEKINSPVEDIMDLARRKLSDLGPSQESASYRAALQERMFHDYMRLRRHGAAIQSAIRSRGFFQGLFHYMHDIFHPWGKSR